MLDRFDIHIQVSDVDYSKLETRQEELSIDIKKRVNKSRDIQINRYKEFNIFSNSELTPKLMEKYCNLDEKSNEILKNSFKKLKLSVRAYSKILKVARTIADLENKENIEMNHIIEAIQYRSLDRT